MPVKQISPEQQQLNDLRFRIRHSAAHIMAEAVLDLFPEAKFAVGPPTDDGFYYDFSVGRPFTPEDLGSIEDRMRETIASGARFERTELPRAAAKERFAGQPFKLEIIDGIPDDEAVTTYAHAAFVDLCRGPHVDSAGEVAAFKLTSVAGAYWRGDEHNEMLQRIYGTAWESEDALIAHLNRLEEAAKRDHRKLGQELGLFFFDPIAPASPFFLPKGASLNNTLVSYVRGLYQRYGYQEVITPQVFDSELWKRSGHYDNYKEHMYFTYVDDREFGVKPMNCPAAAMLYAAQLHSYRDLPVRYADFGRLHRFERSGVTHGLTRVRTFSQDDAHIFCAPWQVESEIVKFIAMVRETYDVFGFEDVRVALSLRPEKRIGSDELWDAAEGALASALDIQGLEYEPVPNEGAFYGPKIDFFVADAIGREWQLSTVQLDYNLPERFDLEFVDSEGARQRPVVIHRAMLGSLERFLGVMIEHYGGAFPTWLAPVQAEIIPIADRHVEYAERVRAELEAAGLRVHVDDRNERMNAKLRDAEKMQTPYMHIVGDKEADRELGTLRSRSGEDLVALSRDKVVEIIHSKPFRVGKRLLVQLPGHRGEAQPDDVVIEMDLSRAYGTAHHPTTRRTLECMEQLIKPGMSVLDVGAGSGVLSIGAAKLGAEVVIGIEEKADAYESAQGNVRRNRVAEQVSLYKGSVPSNYVPPGSADLVLANLDSQRLVALASELRRALKPQGRLVAAGIRQKQREQVERAFSKAGLTVLNEYLDNDWEPNDWVTLVCTLTNSPA